MARSLGRVGRGHVDDEDWERPAPTPQQQRTDIGVGLALAAATAGSTLLTYSVGISIGPSRPSMAEAVAWSVAVSLPLVVRRRFPLSCLVAISVAFIGMQARLVPESQMSSVTLFLALFTAGAWGRDRRITRYVRLAVVAVMFAWLAYALSTTAWGEMRYGDTADGPIPPATASMIYVTALNVGYFTAGMLFGSMAWNQARQRELLTQRNAELAAERDRTARQAVLAERVRIARELHDVVAHHVSVMGIQAAGARRVLGRDPELAKATLEQVEESGRTAVNEMHRLLGVLRAEEPEAEEQGLPATQPQPGLERLDLLVAGVQAGGQSGGPDADLTVVGDPMPVPRSVSVSAYRVVQEALTNVLRHAGATRVDVRVRYLADALEVEVVDDGHAGRHGPASQGSSGLGLVGMRERIAIHGGQLDAGPRPDRGFRVRARFPITQTGHS